MNNAQHIYGRWMPKKLFSHLVLFSALTIWGSGCATPFKMMPGEKSATLKVLYASQVKMCRDGKVYSLKVDRKTGEVQIPADQRINIGTYKFYSGYSYSYSCTPWISFTPTEGGTYFSDAHVIGERCFLELVKADEVEFAGVTTEHSAGKRDCFPQ